MGISKMRPSDNAQSSRNIFGPWNNINFTYEISYSCTTNQLIHSHLLLLSSQKLDKYDALS